MANITVTTNSNMDSPANLALNNNETITINSGVTLTVNSDHLYSQPAGADELEQRQRRVRSGSGYRALSGAIRQLSRIGAR